MVSAREVGFMMHQRGQADNFFPRESSEEIDSPPGFGKLGRSCPRQEEIPMNPWRRIGALVLALSLALLLTPDASGQEKQDKDKAGLAKAFQEADVVFTATVEQIKPIAQTNSIPPSIRGDITFKDVEALRGTPAGKKFAYTYKKGTTRNLDLGVKGRVVVAVKQKAVTALVPATEANLALAKTPKSK
jgi:hypothetical protein